MLRAIARGFVLALALALAVTAPALAVDPSPSPGALASPILIDPLDPRAGEGASSIGAPLLALLVVVGAGALAAAVTYVYATRMKKS